MKKQILAVALALAGTVWMKGMFAQEAAAPAGESVTNAAAVAEGAAESAEAAAEAPKESWRGDYKCEIVPTNAEEYGIWYAYAEVFSDVACDRWIAVGSDDRSDIWINDVPVWGSSNKLKSWRVDDGYRRIRLNRGRNRILARVENGWHALGWSVSISLEDGPLPPQ